MHAEACNVINVNFLCFGIKPFKCEAQTALFKDPERTAQ